MRIYEFLSKIGSASVKDVVAVVKLTQPTVSYHLHDMQNNGLLQSKKLGKEVYFEINPQCPISKGICIVKEQYK